MTQIRLERPKARKPHVCIWCGESIPAGEVYVRDTGEYDGFQSNPYHDLCFDNMQMWAKEDHGFCEFTPGSFQRGSMEER